MRQRNTTRNVSWWGVMTWKRIGQFFLIHPGTLFQKSAFSGSENARSVWTVIRNAQDLTLMGIGEHI